MGLSYEEINQKLEIRKVDELIHHEERIAKNIIKLKEAMLNVGKLVDPIIIDNKHGIVLDGNHRLKVLQMIRVPNAICQVVDYNRPNIIVGGWFPTSERLNKELFSKYNIEIEEVDEKQGKEEIENMRTAFMLVKKGKHYLISPSKYNLDEMINEQQRILSVIGNNFSYIADDVIEDELKIGNGALFRKNYTKDEIIKRSLYGKPFPPKSTRHLIPDRIIRLNMRLGWLHQEPKEARAYLDRLLKNRIYAGNIRRYAEPVVVIY